MFNCLTLLKTQPGKRPESGPEIPTAFRAACIARRNPSIVSDSHMISLPELCGAGAVTSRRWVPRQYFMPSQSFFLPLWNGDFVYFT